jgi:hypothetical protein
MAKYNKSSSIQGAWLKNTEVVSGSKCKLVGEVNPIPDNFNGGKFQDVGKVRFEGNGGEAKNVRLNRATINALIDAFGEESKEWMGHTLTAHTEKMIVGGKRVTALYLVPDGYKVGEDENGYIVVIKADAASTNKSEPSGEEEVNPEDIP